jgi:hypothetical protein
VRKIKAEVETTVGWCARAQLPRGLWIERCRVAVVWYAPDDHRRGDADSLGPLTKAALDGLVGIGVLPDDDHRHVVSVEQSIRVDGARPRIEVELTDARAQAAGRVARRGPAR